MELELFQDNLWFTAAVAWTLAALLLQWPSPSGPNGGRRWCAFAGALMQAASAVVHMYWYDAGTPETLLYSDLWSGLLAALGAVLLLPAPQSDPAAPPRLPKVHLAGIWLQALLWPSPLIIAGVLPALNRTDFLPWGTGRAALALALGLGCLATHWRACPQPKGRRNAAPAALALVLVAGLVVVEGVSRFARERVLEATLVRVASLALAIDSEAIEHLQLGPETHRSAAFATLRAEALKLRRANPDIAYLYLAAIHEGHVVYPVSAAEAYQRIKPDGSSELISEQDEPYEVGPKVDDNYRHIFASDRAMLDGVDYVELYGSLISVLAPLRTSTGSLSPYRLGIDFRPVEMLKPERQARRLAQALVLAGVLAVLAFLRFQITGETIAEVRIARETAEQREKTRNEFLGMISHELQTPVHALLAQANSLRAGTSPLFAATEVDRNATELQRLVEDLLQASALQSPSFRLRPKAFELGPALHEAAAAFIISAEQRGLGMEVILAPNLPTIVQADTLRLRQVVTNLLSNAVKYADRGIIRLEARPGSRPGIIEVAVSDEGPGLPPGAAERIFEPFHREETHAARASGAGLGLAVARELCRRMGGDLTVSPAATGGTVFTATLSAPSEERAAASLARTGEGRLALVVEDHPTLRAHLATQLESLGWRTLVATSAEEALVLLRGRPAGLVLVDAHLAGLSGAELIGRIRETPTGPASGKPWIIGLSASRDAQVADALLEAGADDFLFKPITTEALRLATATGPENAEASAAAQPSQDLRRARLLDIARLVAVGRRSEARVEAHQLLNDALAGGLRGPQLDGYHELERILASARADEEAGRCIENLFKTLA